jgi:hypothetical protein
MLREVRGLIRLPSVPFLGAFAVGIAGINDDPTTAGDLVARVIRAYGGATRWESARAASGNVRLGGQLFKLKHLALPPSMEITTQLRHPHARLDPIDAAGNVGLFEGTNVWLESPDGVVVERRDNVRASLLGAHAGRGWDALDLTYFLGYAFWGYNALIPWLLRDDIARQTLAPGVLELNLPEGTPAHCLTQRFHFASGSALLTRNDYHPDVVTSDPNRWVANIVRRHYHWHGIPYPSRRRVKLSPGGKVLPFPTFVSIDVSDWRLLD